MGHLNRAVHPVGQGGLPSLLVGSLQHEYGSTWLM